jgi:hypothetical protein
MIYSLTRFQDCLSQVHTLKVLHLTTYPACWRYFGSEGMSMKMRELTLQHVLKTVADKIFQALVPTCPKFLAVILDVQGDFLRSAFDQSYLPHAFIRSKQIDPAGRSTCVGAPVKPTMVKHYEPCFDLLDPEAYFFD